MKEINAIEVVNTEDGNVISSNQFHPSVEVNPENFKDYTFKFKEETRGGYQMNVMEFLSEGGDVNLMDILKIVYA